METNVKPQETFQRFHILHRILHIVIIFNFTLLAVTGFLLHFSGFGWARFLVSLMGGAGAAGWLHRFLCRISLYGDIGTHLLAFLL